MEEKEFFCPVHKDVMVTIRDIEAKQGSRLCTAHEVRLNSMETSLEKLINLRTEGIEKIMTEREKAAIIAAQAFITRESQEQMVKFALKKDLDERIKTTQDQITGPLGLELRMRIVEQESHGSSEREKRIAALELSRGSVDAKMFMIVIGLSAFITAAMTAILHFLFKG
jgi:hypothetical protein